MRFKELQSGQWFRFVGRPAVYVYLSDTWYSAAGIVGYPWGGPWEGCGPENPNPEVHVVDPLSADVQGYLRACVSADTGGIEGAI